MDITSLLFTFSYTYLNSYLNKSQTCAKETKSTLFCHQRLAKPHAGQYCTLGNVVTEKTRKQNNKHDLCPRNTSIIQSFAHLFFVFCCCCQNADMDTECSTVRFHINRHHELKRHGHVRPSLDMSQYFHI